MLSIVNADLLNRESILSLYGHSNGVESQNSNLIRSSRVIGVVIQRSAATKDDERIYRFGGSI